MKTWENKVVKIVIILIVLLVITCSSTDSNSYVTFDNKPELLEKKGMECKGQSEIVDNGINHPEYMVLKNGVKLQYANGITIYLSHKALMNRLMLELFPLNAKVTYNGYLKDGICIPKMLTIENECNY